MQARLYYEAHITVEPKPNETFEEFSAAFSSRFWRGSTFAEDEVDRIKGKWFLSGKDQDLAIIRGHTRVAVGILARDGYTVLRYKIEDAILDSKYGDVL